MNLDAGYNELLTIMATDAATRYLALVSSPYPVDTPEYLQWAKEQTDVFIEAGTAQNNVLRRALDSIWPKVQGQLLEAEHALEHVAECTVRPGCEDCRKLAQSALDGLNREDFEDLAAEVFDAPWEDELIKWARVGALSRIQEGKFDDIPAAMSFLERLGEPYE
ncbi:MAG TPA: hypothetical protein VJ742_12830 [Nitrososphaera sp.]|nr:hypothetical protein [Nitrososphaera sp.]